MRPPSFAVVFTLTGLLLSGGSLVPLRVDAQEPGKPPVAGEDDPPLPKLIDMPLPTAESLLRDPPRDWIVLLNQDVLVVEPVLPRAPTRSPSAKRNSKRHRNRIPPSSGPRTARG
jgi:hypothetical protein